MVADGDSEDVEAVVKGEGGEAGEEGGGEGEGGGRGEDANGESARVKLGKG